MESFHWTAEFETGLADVDAQHRRLVDLINGFGRRLAEDDLTADALTVLLDGLQEYARYHFRDEEDLMRRLGVSARHVEAHAAGHADFLNEVVTVCAGIAPEDKDRIKDLHGFLIHWLAYHILGSDQDMARQIAAIGAGASPDDAYDEETARSQKSTEPLIVSLIGLFDLLSARNKELVALNKGLEEKVAERTRDLREANGRLETMALTDALTGLENRRSALRELQRLWDESVDSGRPLSCLMIDADGFKAVNDTAGHAAGDEVLRRLAESLRDSFRTDDVVCRMGGDEFFVICPDTDLAGCAHIAELMRLRVAALRVPAGAGSWKGSVSVGIAARTEGTAGPDDLVKAADRGVYAAKEAGKDCVRTAP